MVSEVKKIRMYILDVIMISLKNKFMSTVVYLKQRWHLIYCLQTNIKKNVFITINMLDKTTVCGAIKA